MNNLWTFGCSFTAEYDPIDGIFFPFENDFDRYKKWRGGNFPPIWPTILADKFNCRLMNCGIGGSSNYNIFNQFINVCDLIKKDDIVVFGWTSLTRFIAVNLDENIFAQMLICENNFGNTGFSKRTIEEIMYNRSHILWAFEVNQWISFINVYLNKIGANVFHWTADENIFNQHTIKNDDQKFIVIRDKESIKTNIMGYLNLPIFYDGKLKGRIVEETDGVIKDDHMGEFGHKNQANYFYNHIIKNIQ
jgi:hypothetical protein